MALKKIRYEYFLKQRIKKQQEEIQEQKNTSTQILINNFQLNILLDKIDQQSDDQKASIVLKPVIQRQNLQKESHTYIREQDDEVQFEEVHTLESFLGNRPGLLKTPNFMKNSQTQVLKMKPHQSNVEFEDCKIEDLNIQNQQSLNNPNLLRVDDYQDNTTINSYQNLSSIATIKRKSIGLTRRKSINRKEIRRNSKRSNSKQLRISPPSQNYTNL
ncbi:UNKNOWN [Stylonychia lemnae]|uniref:Uncharacterized protein n=1 Tax=Stylonychia lemnae TaxID=5949 RepID=A0A078AAK4_STYLE|nr:UNKNOWN [Stylonychia lemnae]|eukprot:CDW78617.1 UNKNOWN [Stylonychia lemnae]